MFKEHKKQQINFDGANNTQLKFAPYPTILPGLKIVHLSCFKSNSVSSKYPLSNDDKQ